MTKIALALLSLTLVPAQQQTQELPPELDHLKALVVQENQLVDAARDFDKAQTRLGEGELEEAQELAKSGHVDEAKEKKEQALRRFRQIRTAYEFVLHHYPKNARAKTYHGEVLYDRFGDMETAVKDWVEAATLDPKLSSPYNDLGIHYCHFGEYTKGLQYYDKALELDPDNPDYLYNIVQTYLTNFPEVQSYRKWDKKKVYRQAMKLSKKAAKLAPNDFDLVRDYAMNFFAAENFGVKADWKDAAEAWQRALPLARNDAERLNAWLNEARVWKQAKDPAKARSCIEEVLKIQPNNAVVKRLLSELPEKALSETRPPKTNVMSRPAQ
jgi:tetratricopeptide (TPR) repeat protein